MLRLEARDVGRAAKDEMDNAFEKLSKQIAIYSAKSDSASSEQLKEGKLLCSWFPCVCSIIG